MITAEHTQSLADFNTKAAETLDRLNRTGAAEIITVDGQARAVLLSPAVYDELSREAELSRDVESIRRSMKDIENGDYMEAGEFFKGLRTELLAMKAAQEAGSDK